MRLDSSGRLGSGVLSGRSYWRYHDIRGFLRQRGLGGGLRFFTGGIFDPAQREGSDIGVVSEGGIAITRIDLAGRLAVSEASKLAIEGQVQ